MTNERKPRRSAEEILAAKEIELEKARLRAAKEAGKSHPVIATLLGMVANLSKDLSVARRGFVKGRQNFQTRIDAHKAWIAEIEAEQNYAQAASELIAAERDFYNSQISDLMPDVIAGNDITSYDEFEAGDTPEEVDVFYAAFLAERNARKALTASKNAEEETPAEATAEA